MAKFPTQAQQKMSKPMAGMPKPMATKGKPMPKAMPKKKGK